MNREIKFRVWDKERKRFIENVTFADKRIPSNWKEHFIFQQFTGEYDDKGKEVYEGDILRITDHGECEWVDAVKFKDGAFQVEVLNQDYDITAIGWMDDYAVFEVIGNIHEHPERLKSEV